MKKIKKILILAKIFVVMMFILLLVNYIYMSSKLVKRKAQITYLDLQLHQYVDKNVIVEGLTLEKLLSKEQMNNLRLMPFNSNVTNEYGDLFTIVKSLNSSKHFIHITPKSHFYE